MTSGMWAYVLHAYIHDVWILYDYMTDIMKAAILLDWVAS